MTGTDFMFVLTLAGLGLWIVFGIDKENVLEHEEILKKLEAIEDQLEKRKKKSE